MAYSIIAKEYRNNLLENVHEGVICVVDEHKQVIYEKGNVEQEIYYRSAMKPIQAIPVFTTDFIEKYELAGDEAALFMASQRGESYHEAALLRLQSKMQVDEECLVCAESYPLNEQPKMDYVIANKPKRKLLHNCAGKHLGFFGYMMAKGLDFEGYDQLSHPLQQAILQKLSELSEVPIDQITSGVDGCGVPVHAIPLKNMAISYLKFVMPEEIEDEQTRRAVIQIGDTMNAQPNIIASHDFICSVLLKDPNIIAKGGAQGVYCIALRKEKISIALKVLSGTELIWPLLVAEILQKLNYSNQTTIDNLLKLKPAAISNDAEKVVGETKICL